MYCPACGAVVQEGSLLCMTCGAPQRERAPEAPRTAPVLTLSEELPGAKCPLHAGMPLLGQCPRCGRAVCLRCAPGAVNDVLTCTSCLPLTAAHQRAPAGAVCAVHTGVPSTFVCARCGAFACNDCIPAGRGFEGQCARCVGLVPYAPLATRGARFVANLIDSFLVLGLALAGVFVAAAVSGVAGKNTLIELLIVPAGALGALIGGVVQLVAQLTWGQSSGKRLMKIKVVRLDGSPIELWRLIILRNLIVQVISQACGFVGLIDALMIFGEEQRCLHDHLADSKVVAVTETSA